MKTIKPVQPPTSSRVTSKDSEDCCFQCGLLISSKRQIKHPGCCFCQACADKLLDPEHSK